MSKPKLTETTFKKYLFDVYFYLLSSSTNMEEVGLTIYTVAGHNTILFSELRNSGYLI